jgi:hypothetical protein
VWGESRRPGGTSIQLPPSAGGRPTMAHGATALTGGDGGLGEAEEGDDPGWAGLGRIGRAERAGCENFQGNDLSYQGESGRIDNGWWQILFTIFKQRFGF